MHTAPHPSSLSTPQHQGGTARFFRRLGGTARSVIAGGIALTGGMRRPAAPKPVRNPPAPRDTAPRNPPASRDTAPRDLAAPSVPSPPRTARRPRAAAPVPPPQAARSGWFARWFGSRRCQPASPDWPAPADFGKTPFTPEAYPGLSAEDCAILNTPVEECDPELLRVILVVLAEHIVDSLPPELGMDAKALFSTLCGRLGAEPDEAAPDAPPAEQPAAAPAVSENAEADAPPAVKPAAAPDAPPAEENVTAPATPTDAEPNAPPASPKPAVETQQTEPADDAAIAAIAASPAWETTPDAASLTGFLVHHVPSRFDVNRSFRHRRGALVQRRRSGFHRGLRDGPPGPPPRRLCYAACAGPP